MSDPFSELPRGYFKVIAADPPWEYKAYSAKGYGRSAQSHYDVLTPEDLKRLPVVDLAGSDCHLFMWATFPCLPQALALMEAWGFRYSGSAFLWVKTNPRAGALFFDAKSFHLGLGHTTRKNGEICILGRRGSPKRLRKDVRELIIAPRREHSRKPDEFYDRVRQYAAGPYLDLFSRQVRPGWTSWGNETGKFGPLPNFDQHIDGKKEAYSYDGQDDFAKSLEVGYAAIRERVAAGGTPWVPK